MGCTDAVPLEGCYPAESADLGRAVSSREEIGLYSRVERKVQGKAKDVPRPPGVWA